ncbi:MAG: hypothetical protein HY000_07290, partial [Planctomycetes bacterium]|nr:hypothetical protein [Planctomycetota bacterium]
GLVGSEPVMAWLGAFRSRRWYGNSSASSSSSLLEEALRPFTTQLPLQGPDGKTGSPLGPRTYVAIVDRPPLVEFGVRDTVDTGSLYVIWGAY